MVIWVKELEGVLQTDKAALWIKKDKLVKRLNDLSEVNKQDDIIFVSNMDQEMISREYKVFIYEDCFEQISGSVIDEFRLNYDYYYLNSILNNSTKLNNKDTIITGSSYGLYAIDESLLMNEVNCSLNSQDLYYTMKVIDRIVSTKEIRNIVICCGYYYFYSDLSRTQQANEIQRVSNVYYPIFKDMHNCMLLPPREKVLLQSEIFDVDYLLKIYSMGESSYFSENRDRKTYAAKLWSDKSKGWQDLCEEEKVSVGRKRAELHNKCEKRIATLNENKLLFSELMSYCNKKNINLFFVVTPATKYYRTYLSDRFKDTFYEVLNESDGEIYLLDLFENESFNDTDFVDTDHLSDSGANKLTHMILDIIR